eukprot:47829-Eustigmatos_ZCMA.PRE.1
MSIRRQRTIDTETERWKYLNNNGLRLMTCGAWVVLMRLAHGSDRSDVDAGQEFTLRTTTGLAQ